MHILVDFITYLLAYNSHYYIGGEQRWHGHGDRLPARLALRCAAAITDVYMLPRQQYYRRHARCRSRVVMKLKVAAHTAEQAMLHDMAISPQASIYARRRMLAYRTLVHDIMRFAFQLLLRIEVSAFFEA